MKNEMESWSEKKEIGKKEENNILQTLSETLDLTTD